MAMASFNPNRREKYKITCINGLKVHLRKVKQPRRPPNTYFSFVRAYRHIFVNWFPNHTERYIKFRMRQTWKKLKHRCKQVADAAMLEFTKKHPDIAIKRTHKNKTTNKMTTTSTLNRHNVNNEPTSAPPSCPLPNETTSLILKFKMTTDGYQIHLPPFSFRRNSPSATTSCSLSTISSDELEELGDPDREHTSDNTLVEFVGSLQRLSLQDRNDNTPQTTHSRPLTLYPLPPPIFSLGIGIGSHRFFPPEKPDPVPVVPDTRRCVGLAVPVNQVVTSTQTSLPIFCQSGSAVDTRVTPSNILEDDPQLPEIIPKTRKYNRKQTIPFNHQNKLK